MAVFRDTTISRRGIGAVGALLAMGINPVVGRGATPNPDAELLALADEFIELEHRVTGLYGEGPFAHLDIGDDQARDDAIDLLRARQDEIQDALEGVRATTLAGLLARVRMLEASGPEWRAQPDSVGDVIAVDLLLDIHAIAGGASA